MAYVIISRELNHVETLANRITDESYVKNIHLPLIENQVSIMAQQQCYNCMTQP